MPRLRFSPRLAVLLQTGNPATIAVAAGGAYYVGSLVGLALRLPPATPSVVWPPNAILTALLLFVPVGRWWSVLAGAAVAHLAVQLPVWTPALVASLFLTNCSEALIAAGLIRYLSDQPSRLDTLRRASIFLLSAVLVAPFVSTFLDAGVVHLINGEDYWRVWKIRFPSNALAQLAIVPAIAGILNTTHGVFHWPRRRGLEAAAVAAGFVLVAIAVSLDAGRIGLSTSPHAPFLPLLLWAAVRFGSAGLGLAALGTVLVSVAGTLHGAGVFTTMSAEDRIKTLQVFLISATAPLMCVGALVEERRRMLKALRSSDILKTAVLTSIPGMVAVIDRNGRILTVNETWRNAQDKGIALEFSHQRGASYLSVWAAGARQGIANAQAGYDGIRSVLRGSAPAFALEYCSEPQRGGQWWMMSVVRLKTHNGGAVITHTDVTARKRAEIEAQRSRDELTHASRVWVLGELTAALSHQLNQPLTGIIANAHAGRRLLDATPPEVIEVNHILTDIVADAQRASDVTRTIRDMLQKDSSEDEVLDVNDVVRDTIVLVQSQAVRQHITLDLRLGPSLPRVRGKRVQLRQVVLNLTINAMESVNGPETVRPRAVIVSTGRADTTAVQVSVADTGSGLPPGCEEQVFEPLFTTKASGMGMGLPIARTIVEAHGGTLWTVNGPAGGAVFHFTLPVSQEQSVRASG